MMVYSGIIPLFHGGLSNLNSEIRRDYEKNYESRVYESVDNGMLNLHVSVNIQFRYIK